MTARLLRSTADYLDVAVDLLRRGGLVISPTVTNYNLICDATNHSAVAAVFRVKRRTKLGPLPVSLPDPERIPSYVVLPEWFDVSILGELLPGEVSFVFHQRYPFPDQLTCGFGTVAVSCSSHAVFRSIVRGVDGPVAATSANVSGQGNVFVSLSKAIADLGDEVDLIVDGGPTDAELSPEHANRVNTIIDLTFDPPQLCRPGWVSVERIQQYIPNLRTDPEAYQRLLRARAEAAGLTR